MYQIDLELDGQWQCEPTCKSLPFINILFLLSNQNLKAKSFGQTSFIEMDGTTWSLKFKIQIMGFVLPNWWLF